MKKYIQLTLIGLGLSACSLFVSNEIKGQDGGVFKSFDKGDAWQHAVLIPSINEQKPSIAHTNIVSFEVDPQDHLALYIGTRENGMFYTYNGGSSWFKSPIAVESRINDIAVDPKEKCTIYAAIGNQVFKSVDCSRTWSGIYVQNDPKQQIMSIDVDWDRPNIIYAGDVGGNVFKSTDFATSWTNIARFKNSVKNIIIDPNRTDTIFVATATKGIQKSVDGGLNWINLSEGLKDFKGAGGYRKLILNPVKPDSLLYASTFGLLKTEDGGLTWQEIPLLTGPRGASIFSLAVNPKNDDEIYYATNRTLYKTKDGGSNWITKKLGTTRIPTDLWVDTANPNIIYMLVAASKK